MKPHYTALASMLLVAACSEDGSGLSSPAPTPAPSPAPGPEPLPTPTATLTAAPISYLKFSENYVLRQGAGVTFASACSGFIIQNQPPAVLPTSLFGQGLPFRFVLTPNVWAIGGEAGVSFDGRNGDASFSGTEVGFAKMVGADTARFSITQPVVGGAGLDYVRLASVVVPVQGLGRQYHCVIGTPTLAADLAAAPSGAFTRGIVMATAHVRDGSASRAYSLGRSVVSVTAAVPASRMAISVKLIGTPAGANGPDVDLGTLAASAPIDSATGNFAANLTSGDRTITTGAVSGRFFGPQAVEVGAAFGVSVADSAGAPGYSAAGALYGVRFR